MLVAYSLNIAGLFSHCLQYLHRIGPTMHRVQMTPKIEGKIEIVVVHIKHQLHQFNYKNFTNEFFHHLLILLNTQLYCLNLNNLRMCLLHVLCVVTTQASSAGESCVVQRNMYCTFTGLVFVFDLG